MIFLNTFSQHVIPFRKHRVETNIISAISTQNEAYYKYQQEVYIKTTCHMVYEQSAISAMFEHIVK